MSSTVPDYDAEAVARGDWQDETLKGFFGFNELDLRTLKLTARIRLQRAGLLKSTTNSKKDAVAIDQIAVSFIRENAVNMNKFEHFSAERKNFSLHRHRAIVSILQNIIQEVRIDGLFRDPDSPRLNPKKRKSPLAPPSNEHKSVDISSARQNPKKPRCTQNKNQNIAPTVESTGSTTTMASTSQPQLFVSSPVDPKTAAGFNLCLIMPSWEEGTQRTFIPIEYLFDDKNRPTIERLRQLAELDFFLTREESSRIYYKYSMKDCEVIEFMTSDLHVEAAIKHMHPRALAQSLDYISFFIDG